MIWNMSYLHSNNCSFIPVWFAQCLFKYFSSFSPLPHYALSRFQFVPSSTWGVHRDKHVWWLFPWQYQCSVLTPSNYLVTLYYGGGYFTECSLNWTCSYDLIWETEHCQHNILPPEKKMFLVENSVHASFMCSEITLCLSWYLSDKVITTVCAEAVSRTEIFRKKDCCYTSHKKMYTIKKVI